MSWFSGFVRYATGVSTVEAVANERIKIMEESQESYRRMRIVNIAATAFGAIAILFLSQSLAVGLLGAWAFSLGLLGCAITTLILINDQEPLDRLRLGSAALRSL